MLHVGLFAVPFFPEAHLFQFPALIGAHHGRGHDGTAHAHQLDEGGAQGQAFEDMVFQGQAAGDGAVGHEFALLFEVVQVLVEQAFDVDGGDAPLVHHAPGAHAGAAAGAVHREQVDLGIGGEFHRPGQVHRPVGPGLEGDALGADVAQVLHRLMEFVFIHHAHPGMAFEFLDALGQVALFGGRVGGVGQHDVAPAPEELGPLQGVELDFAADVLGPLPPLEFEELDPQFFDDVFRDAQAAVLNVGLDNDVALALIPFPEGLDAALHFRGADDAAAFDVGVRGPCRRRFRRRR